MKPFKILLPFLFLVIFLSIETQAQSAFKTDSVTSFNTQTIKKRLEVFFAETAPLIDYYSQSGKLLEIKGEGSMEEIGQRIVSALKTQTLQK